MIFNNKTLFFLSFLFFISCHKKRNKFSGNELSLETSPYLLQHANNPVNWKAWNSKTLELAKKEQKLIVISVGYSACHWCHVMEEESFENDSIAKIMNKNFINIKVDREERPDVDNVYMNAVQLMTGKGGWPLNCIALPNGKPIFGGTYFTKNQWEKVLTDILKMYKENPDKVIEYADNLTKGIQNSELIALQKKKETFTKEDIEKAISNWKPKLDTIYGGLHQEIKFPMPNTLDFLLRYSYHLDDENIEKYVEKSLTKLAFGGIYDQVNGGFSRYSTDKKWHIPHFEKMLYDNAQLVSLYSKAYQLNKKELYKNVIEETLSFVKKELTPKNGAFYSSLDADSKNKNEEKEEGAYYYWTKEELKNIITDNYSLFTAYYNINNFGLWEKERYVLIRSKSDNEFQNEFNIDEKRLTQLKAKWKKALKKARKLKAKPNIDDKVLTSWNALMLKGYVDAYKALGKEEYLITAIKNANFLLENQLKKDGSLYRNYKNGKSSINAYAEDYATLIDAYIALYEVTFDEKWLQISKNLMDYVIKHFLNKENKMFYFTSDLDKNLIAKDIKVDDNVISSSNSILANCLFKLGLYYYDENYQNSAKQMLTNLKTEVIITPYNYSNWLHLYISYTNPFYEVVINGKNANNLQKGFIKNYIPNIVLGGSNKEEETIPLLENKYLGDETFIYICNFGTCKLPQKKLEKAINLIKK